MTYAPPKVWTWDTENGGKFSSINRPTSGPTYDEELPVGKHPLQLYSQGTPNGVKVTVMLEELITAGHADAEYDAWLIDIGKGMQFSSGFVDINILVDQNSYQLMIKVSKLNQILNRTFLERRTEARTHHTKLIHFKINYYIITQA